MNGAITMSGSLTSQPRRCEGARELSQLIAETDALIIGFNCGIGEVHVTGAPAETSALFADEMFVMAGASERCVTNGVTHRQPGIPATASRQAWIENGWRSLSALQGHAPINLGHLAQAACSLRGEQLSGIAPLPIPLWSTGVIHACLLS